MKLSYKCSDSCHFNFLPWQTSEHKISLSERTRLFPFLWPLFSFWIAMMGPSFVHSCHWIQNDLLRCCWSAFGHFSFIQQIIFSYPKLRERHHHIKWWKVVLLLLCTWPNLSILQHPSKAGLRHLRVWRTLLCRISARNGILRILFGGIPAPVLAVK